MTRAARRKRAQNPLTGDIIVAGKRKAKVVEVRHAGMAPVLIRWHWLGEDETYKCTPRQWRDEARKGQWRLWVAPKPGPGTVM